MTLLDLIKRYFPESQWNNALAIIYHESGGNPSLPSMYNAGNPKSTGEWSFGLFQINVAPNANSQFAGWPLLDPETNVRAAYELWQKYGWRPWQATADLMGVTAGKVRDWLNSQFASLQLSANPQGYLPAYPTGGTPAPVSTETPPSATTGGTGVTTTETPATAFKLTIMPSFQILGATVPEISVDLGPLLKEPYDYIRNLAGRISQDIAWLGEQGPYLILRFVLIWLGLFVTLAGLVLLGVSFVPRQVAQDAAKIGTIAAKAGA